MVEISASFELIQVHFFSGAYSLYLGLLNKWK